MVLSDLIEKTRTKLNLCNSLEGNLPSWALLHICIGYWARLQRIAGKRYVLVLLSPTREYSAAFAALGAVMAGAELFRDELTWPKFKDLEPKTTVYWSSMRSPKGYSGSIEGLVHICDQEFIEVRILNAPRKSECGTKRQISKKYFQDYKFSIDKPRAVFKIGSTSSAWKSLSVLLSSFSENWLTSDGAESLVVTGVERFFNEAKSVSLISENNQIELLDLLCVERNRDRRISKTKIEPAKGTISGDFPLVILDGVGPYLIQEHIDIVSNLLMILDRTEFDQGVFDDVADLAASCARIVPEELVDALVNLESESELAIFELDSQP